jgi:polar amino acid transport system permease protein
VNSATFKSFEAFLGVAVYYLALTSIWSLVQQRIERRLGRGTTNAVASGPGLAARLIGLRNASGNQGSMR